jgi:hypothetical protein
MERRGAECWGWSAWGAQHGQGPRTHGRTLYFFCCEGCAERFRADPERYLAQIADVVVCPACLAEKPAARTVTVEVAGQTVHVCGCPGCQSALERDPDRLLAPLQTGKARSLAS